MTRNNSDIKQGKAIVNINISDLFVKRALDFVTVDAVTSERVSGALAPERLSVSGIAAFIPESISDAPYRRRNIEVPPCHFGLPERSAVRWTIYARG